MDEFWRQLDTADLPEQLRLELYERTSEALQLHIADVLRNSSSAMKLTEMVETLAPGLERLNGAVGGLLRREVAAEAEAQRKRLADLGAPAEIAGHIVRLFELNGAIGIAALGRRLDVDVIALTNAYTRLGEVLGLDWAQGAANRFQARDQWERLLTAGLAREFEQLRLDFLYRKRSAEPGEAVDSWVATQEQRIEQFRGVVERARHAPGTTAAMLAQIATQARVLLGR
jgi:glutamate dehydrogenase